MQLQDITFNVLKQEIPKQIIFAPNADDSARGIRNETDWNDWKETTLKRWGNVEIKFAPEGKIEQIEILDDKFVENRNKFIKTKLDYFTQSKDELDEDMNDIKVILQNIKKDLNSLEKGFEQLLISKEYQMSKDNAVGSPMSPRMLGFIDSLADMLMKFKGRGYLNDFIKEEEEELSPEDEEMIKQAEQEKEADSKYDVYKRYTNERWDKLAGLK